MKPVSLPNARLMNNTKWRELLKIAGELALEFQVAYLPKREFQWAFLSSEALLGESGLADPGIAGGPAKYSEIWAIRVPKFLPNRNPVSGVRSPDEGLSAEFVGRSRMLGQLPLVEEAEYVYVYGYAH
jgi:hypothetical protein